MIPYGRQDISDADIEAVVEVLKSDFLTQGEQVPRFEQAVCNYVGASHGVAVNSATSALHIACLALGLGPGGRLWTTPVSFVASANCGLYCGAEVDFVDIEPATGNLSVEALATKLEAASADGTLPDILVPVHLGGLPCDMAGIARLAAKYGYKVIEDASHAIGGSYGDKKVGACQHSDIAVFSFHPVKTMTTGEGGLAVTGDSALAERMRQLRSHGIVRTEMTRDDGPWYYEQQALGFNYRMTDILAALGVSQLSRLDSFVKARHRIANTYHSRLKDLPLKLPVVADASRTSGLHLYVVRLDLERVNRTHREVFESLRERGVGVNLHYIPIHLQPYYAQLGFNRGDFPNAEAWYGEAITLPMYPGLTDEDIDAVVSALEASLS